MLFAFLMSSTLTFAQERDCKQITDHRTFYQCSLKAHPLFKAAEIKAREGEALLEQASQWKNPEVNLRTLGGTSAGEQIGTTEVNASVSLSQFWQRGPRKNVAENEKKLANLTAKESELGVKKDIIRSIFRWRQIDVEEELLDETLNTFATIQGQLKTRRAPGPEQEITLSLIDLARSGYEFKKNQLVTEKLEILSKMKAIWGPDFLMQKNYLPSVKEKWPVIESENKPGMSLDLQRVMAEAGKAEAEQRLTDAQSWPEMTLGPSFEMDTRGQSQSSSYGFNFSMTLPLMSLNSGARQLAGARAQAARFSAQYQKRVSDLETAIHLQKYHTAIESLKKSIGQKALHMQHERTDSLFRQGLVPGTLMIEAHRQLNDYVSSQNNHENSALDAYLEIKTLRGEDVGEILQ